VFVLGVGLPALGAVVPSCKPSPRIDERQLIVYSPLSCPVAQSQAFSVIYGNGDFDNSAGTVSSLYLRDVGSTLTELPENTRSVIVDVSQAANDTDWRGTAEVPATGPVHVLVWDQAGTCTLTRDVKSRSDVTFGVFGRHLMVAGGLLPDATPLTYVGDLSTGIVADLTFGLGTRRSHATITAFRETADQDPSPALVAGGEDPAMGPNDTSTPLATAELYLPMPGADGDIGDFVSTKIDLSEPRTKHSAIVLATGETLLVGGIGQSGLPLETMELIDPKTRRFRTSNVAQLDFARSDPTVLRLASGEIFVGGGFDRSNEPVPMLEWFSADASTHSRRSTSLVTGLERSFVPLEAGGVLAVIRPDTGTTDFKTVWVISADGTPEEGEPVDPATLDSVRLFIGTDGAPVLWTGQRWLRWQPWFGTFQPIADAPARGPRSTAIASGDSGLALWLDDRSEMDETVQLDSNQLYIRGYRFATRSRFGTVRNPLLVDDTTGLAPDRLSGTAGGSIVFMPGRGLSLGPGASAFVTDVTYADVNIDLDGETPSVVLRQESGREIEIGGAACPFAPASRSTIHVERVGTRVTVNADTGDAHDCPTQLDPGARISIGVRGASGTDASLAHNLRITRR
jgi:hypothetical protein